MSIMPPAMLYGARLSARVVLDIERKGKGGKSRTGEMDELYRCPVAAGLTPRALPGCRARRVAPI